MRAFITLLFTALLLTAQPPVTAQPDATRPNIVIIMTDDQSLDTLAHMPILQAEMAAKGVTFTNAYTVSPLCCPSRTSILRGQYIHNHGIVFNSGEHGGFLKAYTSSIEGSTLATWLDDAGYNTALIGKYLNQYPSADNLTYIPPGWDEWYAQHTPTGADDYYYGYKLTENGTVVQYGTNPEDYLTDVLAGKAVDFINRAAVSGAPFFVHLSSFAPHYPYIGAPRHVGLFRDEPLPKPPSFNEADVSDKPSGVRNKPRLTSEQITEFKVIYRHQLRTLQAVDEMVGQVVNALDANGVLDNTYIIYLTDNGYHLGTHRLMRGKSRPYLEDVRIPLMVRGAGIPQGVTEARLAATIDLAPTIAQWAGITPPEYVDGRSLVPMLNGEPTEWRTALLTSFICAGGNYPLRKGCFNQLITPQYTYIEYPQSNEVELYDISLDPYQLDNLSSGTPQSTLNAFSRRLQRLLECSGATCRQYDQWSGADSGR